MSETASKVAVAYAGEQVTASSLMRMDGPRSITTASRDTARQNTYSKSSFIMYL